MVCSKCKEEKDIEEYSFRSKKNNTRRSECKTCVKKYRKKYYSENREKGIANSAYHAKKANIRNMQYIWDYLLDHPCVDCGEENPVVLEFDHRDGVEKLGNIGAIQHLGWGINKLKEEIEKCDVRCCNCHRKRTAQQCNWYKNIIR